MTTISPETTFVHYARKKPFSSATRRDVIYIDLPSRENDDELYRYRLDE